MNSGRTLGDALTDSLVDRLIVGVMPKLKQMVAEGATGAEPMVRRVVVEEVLPKFGLATVIGLVAGGVAAAAIGSWFATKRR